MGVPNIHDFDPRLASYLPFKTPSFLWKFPVTFLGVGMDIFFRTAQETS